MFIVFDVFMGIVLFIFNLKQNILYRDSNNFTSFDVLAAFQQFIVFEMCGFCPIVLYKREFFQ